MSLKEKTHEKKIFRLISILNKLNSRGKVYSKELSEEFKVSIRSIQRDLGLLNETGFPLVSLEKGVYSFVEGFSLRKSALTNEEASLLAFLHEIAKSLGKKFEDSFNDILKKVLSSGEDSVFYAKIPEGIKLDDKTPFVKELEDAINQTKKVVFDYLAPSGEKHFEVDPLKIGFYDGFWYLICRVSGKGRIFKLRLENIRRLEVMGAFFRVPKNLQTMLDESVNVWFSEKRDKTIVVRVDKDVARFFKRKMYFPLQKIVKEEKDGSLVIESKVCQDMEVIPVIMRWLPYVKVIKPEAIKKEIMAKVKKYLENES